jgi:glycosyltransferase involved in cell wall biosynthesis
MRALYHHRTQGRGAEAVHIHSFCSGLEQLGYAVEIAGPPGVQADPNAPQATDVGRPKTFLGWVARNIPQAGFEMLEIGYNFAALPRLKARCRDSKPAFIYERYALFNLAGARAARAAGIPFVLEMNDTVHMDRQRQGKTLKMKRLATIFEDRLLRMSTGVAVVSGYLRDHLIERGVPAEAIVVTPNAVHESEFDPERVTGDAVRARCGLGGKLVVGFAGSFAKWHRTDLLVRAAARLKDEFPNLHLLLIGDGAERAPTAELALELGIGDRVTFTGKIPHAAIPEHVAAMDIGVMPESKKIYEYMAMRVTPVGPRYIPVEEAIDHEGTGLIFDPGNLDDLAGCLRGLAADPDYRIRLGEAARRKVLAKHLWVHNARAVVELIERRTESFTAKTRRTQRNTKKGRAGERPIG